MFRELEDKYNDIVAEAQYIVEKYKTPDACKNEQELNDLEDAYNVLLIDEIMHGCAMAQMRNRAYLYDLDKMKKSQGGKKAAANMTARQRKERAKNAIRSRYNK